MEKEEEDRRGRMNVSGALVLMTRDVYNREW